MRWLAPVSQRTGWQWFYLLATEALQASAASASCFEVTGWTAEHASAMMPGSPSPSAGILAASSDASAMAFTTNSAESSASAQPSAWAGEHVVWPRFKTRRLLGCITGERGVGGQLSLYRGGVVLGEGAYAVVRKCSIGGVAWAVKTFQRAQRVDAQLEASIAEQVAGHPHLVCLLDALYDRASSVSYLAYRFAGVELHKRPFSHFSHAPGRGY